MNATQIRELTDEEIEDQIDEAREEIARLRFRASYEDLEDYAVLRTRRREIARLKTIQHERRTSAEKEDQDG